MARVIARSSGLVVVLLLVACEAGAVLGNPCERTSQCARSLVCAVGRCRAGCRASTDCSIGERCLVEPVSGTGVCSLGSSDRCDTSACADGFVCIDGACQNACGRIVACPDGVCVDGACVPSTPIDAGVVDASGADAGADATIDAGPRCPGPRCDRVVQIAPGYGTFCARMESGAVWCWGRCDEGECSSPGITLGACGCAPTPVQASDEHGAPIADASDLAGGENYACALRTGGQVWCWGGYNPVVDLGAPRPVPIQALVGGVGAALDHAVDIEGTRDHACALRDTGELYCWGNARAGALGTANATESAIALLATELVDVRAFAMSFDHTIGVRTDGSVIGVGENAVRQLGGPSPDGGDDAYHAVVNAWSLPARAIATSGGMSCGIFVDGSVPDGRIGCWGDPGYGPPFGSDPLAAPVACPMGSVGQCAAEPTWLHAPTGERWAGLSVDYNIVLAWTDAGSLYGWSTAGSVGAEPERFVGIEGHVTQAVAHWNAICAVTSEGDVWCRGVNDVGQLGRGVLFSAADLALVRVAFP